MTCTLHVTGACRRHTHEGACPYCGARDDQPCTPESSTYRAFCCAACHHEGA